MTFLRLTCKIFLSFTWYSRPRKPPWWISSQAFCLRKTGNEDNWALNPWWSIGKTKKIALTWPMIGRKWKYSSFSSEKEATQAGGLANPCAFFAYAATSSPGRFSLALEVYAGAEYKLRAVRACPAWLEARKRKLATATQASEHITKKTSGLLDRYALGRGCRFNNI